MSQALATLENATRSYTAPGFLLADGSWADLDYRETPTGSWSPWDHTRRLLVLAKAYHTPGQTLHRSPQLLAQINAALAYTRTFYGATIIPTGNWWFWTIGIPLDLGPTLVLMQRDADAALVEDLTRAIHLRILSNPSAKGLVGPTPTGQNLVWSAFTHLSLALLKNDASMMRAVRDAMNVVTLPASGEGIKADSSFHQHGAQLYTGGYGAGLAYEVSRYALFTRGTSYALGDASLASFGDYVADGIAWALYGNYFDVSTIGREVAKPSTTGFNGVAALLQAAHLDLKRGQEIRGATAQMLGSWQWVLPTELAALAASAERAAYAPAAPSGFRHYFASDYTIHRRAGWFASVKMFSSRTKSGERTNDENLLGSRQSDGRFSLSRSGDEYFGHDIWPAFDWTRMPGTTVELKADAASALYGYGSKSYAGGTGNGREGISAMELAPLGSSLFARKAWFFFDDSILFLTNSITSPSAYPVETVVNQWPLRDASATIAAGREPGGDWSVLDGIGYWSPTPGAIRTERTTRSGTWAALGGTTDTTAHTKHFATMTISHGANPVNATAEYAIIPNATATTMRNRAAAPPLQIISNDDTVSAARDWRSGTLGIAFWRAAAIEGISSDSAAVVLVTRRANGLEICAADPNAATTGSFRITIPGRYAVAGAPAISDYRSTTITIPRASGRTTHVILTQTTSKTRAVR
ncbi:MAG: polysaccharide lyase family 8 super-sandwich domain-containing protein [Thermoanaerobaculia bacterium]